MVAAESPHYRNAHVKYKCPSSTGSKVTVKVNFFLNVGQRSWSRSLNLVLFERVSLVEYACRISSLYQLWYIVQFKSYAKAKVFCHRQTDRTNLDAPEFHSWGIKKFYLY